MIQTVHGLVGSLIVKLMLAVWPNRSKNMKVKFARRLKPPELYIDKKK